MKRLILYLLAIVLLGSCSNSGNGELVGTRKNSKPFYQPDPYGMVFVPQGSYTMGAGEEDLTHSNLIQPKTISVSAFYMDETEITNDKYRMFVNWVRDSIARTMLGDVRPEEYLIEENEKTGEVYDPPYLNWKTHERFFRRKEIDTRKLMYEYYWVDLHAAAKKDFSEDADFRNAGLANRPQGLRYMYVKKPLPFIPIPLLGFTITPTLSTIP